MSRAAGEVEQNLATESDLKNFILYDRSLLLMGFAYDALQILDCCNFQPCFCCNLMQDGNLTWLTN